MEYQVQPLGKTCAATGDPLAPGATVFSALVREADGWRRLDYASEAWTAPPEHAVGHWTCRVPEAEVRRELDVDGLMAYFEQITDDPQPSRERLRYVLALTLLQKKRLQLEGTETDPETGDERLLLLGARGEGAFTVRDEQLTEAEIDDLRRDLHQLGGEND